MGTLNRQPDTPDTPPAAFTMDQLREIVTLIKSTATDEAAATKADLSLQMLSHMQGMWDKTVPKANIEGTGRSPFTIKEGCKECEAGERHEDGRFVHAKPQMRYEAYQCGVRLREDQLSITEVELLNQFEQNSEAKGGKWTATIDRKGTVPRLLIQFPATDIMQMDAIPPFPLLLMALLHGERSIDPNNLHDEIKRLRDEIQQMKKAQVAA